jgi:hypothetical protein
MNIKVKNLLPGDFDLWLSQNKEAFERRFSELRLVDNVKNCQVLVRYLRDHSDLEVNLENLFAAIQTPGYREYLEFIPVPIPRALPPTVASLGYTRRKLAKMEPAEMKALLRNVAIGNYAEVQRQIDEIMRQPAEGEGYNRNIDQISVQQSGSGKHNFPASENAKKIARQKLGPRP